MRFTELIILVLAAVAMAGPAFAEQTAAIRGDLASVKNTGTVLSPSGSFEDVSPVINVQGYLPPNAVTDGSVDYTTEVSTAVAAAYAAGRELYWPNVYLTSASIANFHSVKHRGPGGVKRGAYTFYVAPKTGQTNTLYVDAAAADNTGDGLHTSQPIKQISTAMGYLANYGPMLDGSWIIRPAAGTYAGGIAVPRNLQTRDFIKIIGSTTGHPNVPDRIISKAADTRKSYGIYAGDGALLWLEGLKFVGAFDQAVYIVRNSYLQWRNSHIDGAVTGMQLNVHVRYTVTGGIIENCTAHGINELFHVTRDFGTVSNAASQLILRNNTIGLKAKENCIGHLDYVNFEGNGTGLELQLFSGTNPKGATFKRNTVGIVLVNSELHNESSLVWGTGADINTRRMISLGNSSEIDAFGWTDNTTRTGHRPLVLLASSYAEIDHTGTVAEIVVANFASLLKADVYAVKGKKYRVLVKGAIERGTTTVANARLLLRVAGTYMTDVTIPSGTVGTAPFQAEFEVTCTADGAHQYVASSLLVDGKAPDVTGIARTADMTAADRGVVISVVLGNAADKVSIYAVEVLG